MRACGIAVHDLTCEVHVTRREPVCVPNADS